MNIDKNTLIGLLLVLVIILLTPYIQQYLYKDSGSQQTQQVSKQKPAEETKSKEQTAPEKSSKEARDTLDEEETQEEGDTEETQIDSVEFDKAQKGSLDVRTIKVVTKRYKARFSTKGADLKSFILKDYSYGYSDTNVNMVTPDEENVLPYEFTADGAEYSTADYMFSSDADSIIRITEEGKEDTLTFTAYTQDGFKIKRTFIFDTKGEFFDHSIKIESQKDAEIEGGALWWNCGIHPTEKDIEGDLGKYRVAYSQGDEVSKKEFDKDETVQLESTASTNWISTKNRYFTVILSSLKDKRDEAIEVRGEWHKNKQIQGEVYDVPEYNVGIVKEVDDEKGVYKHENTVYIGGQDYFSLKDYDRKYAELIDMGWSWLAPLSYALLWVMHNINKVVPNYGLVIILFTLLIKLVLHPLTRKYMRSMQDMKKIQPQMKQLKEEYENDPQKLNKEMLKLYKEHGVNPLGGCLPMILQMPIFFALFRVFQNTIELRGQPFIFWIQDLSQKDPYYVLPVVMAVMMYLQQKMSVQDPKQKILIYIMPAFFLFLFRNMPAGLVLYWTSFNLINFAYQWYLQREGEEELETEVITDGEEDLEDLEELEEE